jgi:GDP-L-fucose synthase
MKVFIPGHKGLVGSGLLRNLPSGFEIVVASRDELTLTNVNSVFRFLEKTNPEAVILAAAKVGGIRANSLNQYSFLIENLKIQNSVIEAALSANVPNFIFLGSSCIYPKLSEQPIVESSLLSGPLEETNEGYALAKIAGVRLMKAIFDERGLNYFSLMPTNLYGPNDNFDLESSHVPAALLRRFHEAKLKKLPKVEIWGSGDAKREFLHVDDLASACWYFLKREMGGCLINIGSGVDISISDFAKKIAEVVGFEGNMEFNSSMPEGTPRKLLDITKALSLGWQPKISLEDGLVSTYEWFESNWLKGGIRGQ